MKQVAENQKYKETNSIISVDPSFKCHLLWVTLYKTKILFMVSEIFKERYFLTFLKDMDPLCTLLIYELSLAQELYF